MRRAFFAVVLIAGAGVVYACSFPDVEYLKSDGGSEASSGTPTDDSGNPIDAGGDVFEGLPDAGDITITIDGAVYDANFDAGGKIDAAGGCNVCDCDGDGYLNGDSGCSTPVELFDCDDFDSRTHPGAGPYPYDAEAPRFGDWNCSGTPEKVPEDNFDCANTSAGLLGLLGKSCTSVGGFPEVIECGQKGRYLTCKNPPLNTGNCQPGTVGTATQLCK